MTGIDDRTNPVRLQDRHVLVTGAARGLGAAIAARAVAEGATVVLGDVLDDALQHTCASIGARAIGMHLDVTDEADWAAASALVRERLGGRLDVLVNNAGIIRPRPLIETDRAEFVRTLDVNVTGTFLGIQAFAALHREMGATTPGSIINFSSSRGLLAGNNASAYVASKFAVRGLTKAAAVELGGSGIRVNAVCPGPIDTDMSTTGALGALDWDTYLGQLPLRRRGRPDEIATAVCWLASDESSFVTGTEIVVDGGLTSFAISPQPHR